MHSIGILLEDVDNGIAKACKLNSNNDAIYLACVSEIVRHSMFQEAQPFYAWVLLRLSREVSSTSAVCPSQYDS